MVKTRSTFLIQSEFDRLEDWCRMVRVLFGRSFGPFLVGSVTERADYRDVDIRVLMHDEDFDAVFRGRLEAVRFLNRAVSIWGQQETGLPIDFQVQRQTEANEEFPRPRKAMGIRDWSQIPTSGVPKLIRPPETDDRHRAEQGTPFHPHIPLDTPA
jgi:hypothetical protein